jgi:hypothetical protein
MFKISNLFEGNIFGYQPNETIATRVHTGHQLLKRHIGYYDSLDQGKLALASLGISEKSFFPSDEKQIITAINQMKKVEFDKWFSNNRGYCYFIIKHDENGERVVIKEGTIEYVYFLGHNKDYENDKNIYLYKVNDYGMVLKVKLREDVETIAAPILVIEEVEGVEEVENESVIPIVTKLGMKEILESIKAKYEEIDQAWLTKCQEVNEKERVLQQEKIELQRLGKEANLIKKLFKGAEEIEDFYNDSKNE